MRERIEQLFAAGSAADKSAAREVFAELRQALGAGEARAAEPDAASPTGWRVNTWVKRGILLGFRFGDLVDMSIWGGTEVPPYGGSRGGTGVPPYGGSRGGTEVPPYGGSRGGTEVPPYGGSRGGTEVPPYGGSRGGTGVPPHGEGGHAGFPFYDKDTMPLKRPGIAAGVRIVPGGSSVREGAFVARGVICMPPMYINIGAYVGEGTLVDSHALIGSCAQIGARVHVSAAAQIGGVIEPVGAMPVIVEDDVLVGGNTGIYEGAVIKARAVIAAGTVLTGSTPVYDLVKGVIIKPQPGQPLVVPEGAVVVPGARAVTVGAGRDWGLSLATPVIVKYRDDRTDTRTELESWIR